MTTTTIQLDKELLESLKGIKEYPKQSYNELIDHMVKIFKNVKKRNVIDFDDFLDKVHDETYKPLKNQSNYFFIFLAK